MSKRNFASRGSTVTLQAGFYKDGSLTTPVSYGNVAIYRGTTLQETIPSGQITNPSAGILQITYSIASDASLGAYTDTWQDVVLSSGGTSVEYTFSFYVVEANVPVGIDPDMCTVYQYLITDAGVPIVGVSGYAYVTNKPQTFGANTLMSSDSTSLTAESDISGRLAWTLPRNSLAIIDIPDVRLYAKKIIPDQPTASISSLTDSTE